MAGVSNCLPKSTAHLVECARRRALKREDRLLLVADRKDRAPPFGARPSRRKFRDRAHDLPIASGWCPAPHRSAHGRCRDRACRAPRRPSAAEQFKRLVDQVVVVEQAAAFFFSGVKRDDSAAMVTSARVRSRARTARSRSSSLQTRSCWRSAARASRYGFRQLPGDDILARVQIGGAEHFEIIVDAVRGPQRCGRF